jgi:DNA-binding MarR family transcriptional regulator
MGIMKRIQAGSQSEPSQGGAARSLRVVDRLIHEPARLMIAAILSVVESADFLYLQRETGLTKGNLSSHLLKLEEAGYVEIEKTYREKLPLTICRLTPQGRRAFEEYRNQMKKFVEQV